MEAKAFILNSFTKQGDYDFLPKGTLEEMTDKLISLDEAFMEQSGVNDGAVYDDEAASGFILKGMQESFAEFSMYMMRLVDDYLDYNEEYLTSVDGIEWE